MTTKTKEPEAQEQSAPGRLRRGVKVGGEEGTTTKPQWEAFGDELPRHKARAVQPPLFEVSARGELTNPVVQMPPLAADSTLEVARYWFRLFLEREKRPSNTLKSYMYDLALFQEYIGNKALNHINPRDVAGFLAEASNKSTRKRRLTSIGAIYKFLINEAKVVTHDPSGNFFADFIPLKTPQPLFRDEQEQLLRAALAESERSYLMIWLMLRLGVTRNELLQLRPEHIDLSDRAHPVIYIFYPEARHRKKERKLNAPAEFAEHYAKFLEEEGIRPQEHLFTLLPQSINKLVLRIAAEANIEKNVGPQTLRDTFAVECALDAANESQLLGILGLIDDPRNRMSVQRYIKLAKPAVNALAS